MDLPVVLILTALLVTSVYTDLRWGKVYNVVTLPCIGIGFVLGALRQGFAGALYSLGGVVLVLILFLLFAPAAGVGGGDVKLMAAVSAIAGLQLTVWVLLFSAVCGGALSLVVMARHRVLLSTTKQMAGNAYMSILLRSPVDLTNQTSRIKFRYSPAIAIGTIAAVLLKG